MSFRQLMVLSSSLVFAIGCTPTGKHATGDKLGDPMQSDPTVDHDGDGIAASDGDCKDDDATIYPGAPELCDGKDHDCDGIADGTCDDDKDGYAIVADVATNVPGGDCNDQDPLVNPGAIEVPDDMVDNNCDNTVDEGLLPCDPKSTKTDARSFASAIELCDPWVVSATLNNDADARAYKIRSYYGNSYKPKQGVNFIMLSTGLAVDKRDNTFVPPQPGTEFKNDDQNPSPMANKNACYQGPDEDPIHDYVELKLVLKVPTNAKSFSFNFMFDSAEYPDFVGTEFNDKFLALLDSKSFQGNISFDAKMNPITVNAGFFDVCTTADVCNGMMTNVCSKPISTLNGTGMEDDDGSGQPQGGGTGWLTTTAPVTPGETATLRFIIFDEGDHIFDSSVIIDNFQWQATGSTGPTTVG